MRIERKPRYYGYDLVINHVLHKRCLRCESWYEFDGEIGYCHSCIHHIKRLQDKTVTFKKSRQGLDSLNYAIFKVFPKGTLGIKSFGTSQTTS